MPKKDVTVLVVNVLDSAIQKMEQVLVAIKGIMLAD
jgi:hypothetical protein